MMTLIKNVIVLDGTGAAPRKADIIIKRDKIAAIGHFHRYRSSEIIDGMGAYLAPGFIDVNTSSDLFLTLFSNPSQKDFLLQGVTTIIGGQNGISLAPIFYGSLELNKIFTDVHKINVNWHTIGELLDTLEKRRLGVNFGTLVGHATLRESIIGDNFRDLTQNELNVFRSELKKSLEAGALGISINLDFSLTSLTPYKEIKFLAEEVANNKGVVSINLRNCSDRDNDNISAIEEIINLAKETECRIHIRNFARLASSEAELKKIINLIIENSAKTNIYLSVTPLRYFIKPIFSFLPAWASRGSLKEIRDNLKDEAVLAKIKKDLSARLNSEEFKILSAPRHDYLAGKTLKEFSRLKDISTKDALLYLLNFLNLRGSAVYKGYTGKVFSQAINFDRAIVSTGAASFGKKPEESVMGDFYKIFPMFLDFALGKSDLPIERAVRKITSLPAQLLGLKNRGVIKEKYFADLVMFRDSGIENVFVNGKIAVKNGQYVQGGSGKILRKRK